MLLCVAHNADNDTGMVPSFWLSAEATVGRGTTKKEEERKLGNLTFGWSARCRLTWIHHLYLWRNSVPFCCPAENKWSFFRTLAASLELTGTLWNTKIGTSPSTLSTPHIRQALFQPAKSIWLMADFHQQPFLSLNALVQWHGDDYFFYLRWLPPDLKNLKLTHIFASACYDHFFSSFSSFFG